MITRFVEVTDGIAYGKFLVWRLDPTELATKSAMPDAGEWDYLLSYAGRRRFNERTTSSLIGPSTTFSTIRSSCSTRRYELVSSVHVDFIVGGAAHGRSIPCLHVSPQEARALAEALIAIADQSPAALLDRAFKGVNDDPDDADAN